MNHTPCGIPVSAKEEGWSPNEETITVVKRNRELSKEDLETGAMFREVVYSRGVSPGPQDVLRELPENAQERKDIPMCTGLLDYFPLALAEVAKVSKAGNDQHNPGQPLHWARGKSTDHVNCIVRHLVQRGTKDTDGVRHSAKLAWRALAQLQEEIEEEADFKPKGAK